MSNKIQKTLALICVSISYVNSAFKFSSQQSMLSFTGINSSFAVETPITDYSGTLNLKDNVAGTITSAVAGTDTITFTDGVLKTGATMVYMSGTFDPDGTDKIVLGNGDMLCLDAGTILQAVEVSDNASVSILGQPRLSSAVALGTAGTTLSLGIASALNYSITGTGKVALLDDLTLEKDVQLPALVEQNDKKLHITGGSISSGWTNTTGGVIELHSNTTISAALTIGTSGDVYTLNGNGNIITLSGSGSISVPTGVTLHIANAQISGLSTTNHISGAGTVRFSNVTIELANNLNLDTENSGLDANYIFEGDDSKIITNGSAITVDDGDTNSTSSVTVDGIVLYYDQLDGSGNPPFTSITNDVTKTNGGDVKSTSSGSGSSNLVVTGSSYTFTNNVYLTSSASLEFSNAGAVAVDGNGHFISFPKQTGTYMSLSNTATAVTMSDIVLRNFYPDGIVFTGSASLAFGDDTTLEMGQDLTMLTGDKAWTFTGNGCVDGKGGILRIEKASGITIADAKTLTLKNMRLELTLVNGVVGLGNASVIKLENVDLVMANATGFTCSTGHITVAGLVSVSGNVDSVFDFATEGDLTILANSKLTINPDVELKYNIVLAAPADALADKKHIVFTNTSSILSLNNCKFNVAATNGFAFEAGTLEIRDLVTFVTTATDGIQIDDGMRVNVSAGAVLDVDGTLKYVATVA